MKHIIVTLNEEASIAAMQNYSGTELIHKDEDFAFWKCTDMSSADEDAINGYGTAQTVKLIGAIPLNKPLEEKQEETEITESLKAVQPQATGGPS